MNASPNENGRLEGAAAEDLQYEKTNKQFDNTSDFSDNQAPKKYGASPDEWLHFDLILGLTEDLLPVVSDPNAEKSPRSTIKEPGKLPSLFNHYGQMIGFTGWTNHRATPEEIDEWKLDDRFGICVQTRHMRAIDVDITDFDEAFEAEHLILEFFGRKVPVRRRPGSNKFLIPVFIDGDFRKERFLTKSGEKNAIEFLANGQQFIAIGTHKEGMRYEWDGGLPSDFPTLDIAEFKALWSKLNEKLGAAESTTARSGVAPSKARREEDINDPVYDYLVDHWETFDTSRDGRLDIACPFKGGHSTDSGPTSTSYYPAGVGGFERGHFKCLHASCTHRVDNDFLNEIGFNTQGFEVVPVTPDGELSDGARQALNALEHNDRGRALPTLANIGRALKYPELSGWRISFDQFTGAILAAPAHDQTWAPLTDNTLTRIRESLTQGLCRFCEISKDTARDSVGVVAEDQTFDSAQNWLTAQKWDGIKRVDNFLHKYFGAADNEYTRAVSKYWWTALAGRGIVPGIKADMVPIASGRQGLRKTSGVAAIAPFPESFGHVNLAAQNNDNGRLMAGKMIIELGELDGLRKKAITEVKQFISAQHDEWIPKFKEAAYRQPRRCVFIGTTNEAKCLPPDDSGQRRWLPFEVERLVDVDAIIKDRGQLWAEGLVMFRANGDRIMWEDAERLAGAVHEGFVDDDPWDDAVRDYFDTAGGMVGTERLGENGTRFTVVDLLQRVANLPLKEIGHREKLRMGAILTRLGKELGIVKRHDRKGSGYFREGVAAT